MSKLGWLALLLALVLVGGAIHSRNRAGHAAQPVRAPSPAETATAPGTGTPASATKAERHGSSVGGSPLTEPGTTAGIEGILAGSKTTPHLEDATQKARNAMRSYGAAEARDRAALGSAGGTRTQGADEP